MRINDKLKNLLNRARLPRSLESVRFGDLLAGIDHDATVALEGTTTDISEATDGYFATPAEIGLAVMEGTQYSDTQQRIGTWIDGSPIYRKAFDALLKDMPEADYADALSNSAFTVMISGSDSAYPIGAFCAYADANGVLYHCGINALADISVDFGFSFGMAIPKDQSDCTTERFYGYIDFIQTGDDA